MQTYSFDQIQYSIFDPTGNITALVVSDVPAECRKEAASRIMEKHPDVEQTGFVNGRELAMAGGEFCGNACMCAAALMLKDEDCGKAREVNLQVSGVPEPVLVRLIQRDESVMEAAVHMPPARYIIYRSFCFDDVSATLPVVAMEGITHIIIENDSPFFFLLTHPEAAERAIRTWCRELGAEGLGLIFIDQLAQLTPLVYIPAADTLFWEKSCASGTAAAGMYLGDKSYGPVDEAFREPGGSLRVINDPLRADTWLLGKVRFAGTYEGL